MVFCTFRDAVGCQSCALWHYVEVTCFITYVPASQCMKAVLIYFLSFSMQEICNRYPSRIWLMQYFGAGLQILCSFCCEKMFYISEKWQHQGGLKQCKSQYWLNQNELYCFWVFYRHRQLIHKYPLHFPSTNKQFVSTSIFLPYILTLDMKWCVLKPNS